MAQRETDDPRAGSVALVGLVGAITLTAIVIATQALYNAAHTAEQRRQDYATRPAELETLRSEQTASLNTYGYVDEASGRVRIPIDEAMKKLLSESDFGEND